MSSKLSHLGFGDIYNRHIFIVESLHYKLEFKRQRGSLALRQMQDPVFLYNTYGLHFDQGIVQEDCYNFCI